LKLIDCVKDILTELMSHVSVNVLTFVILWLKVDFTLPIIKQDFLFFTLCKGLEFES